MVFQEETSCPTRFTPQPHEPCLIRASGSLLKSTTPSKRSARRYSRIGALPIKTKQLIAVAVAHVTQCPYCIRGHTKAAMRHGATREELMEAIWVAAEMRAGGAYTHSALALDEMEKASPRE